MMHPIQSAVVRGRIEVATDGPLTIEAAGQLVQAANTLSGADLVDAPVLFDLRQARCEPLHSAELTLIPAMLAGLATTHSVAITGLGRAMSRAVNSLAPTPQRVMWFASIAEARRWLRGTLTL